MKKFLFIATLLLSWLPFASTSAQVAKIGSTEYSVLQDAFDAAHEMTGDVTVSLTANASGYIVVHQKAGLNLTIDGNNNTLDVQIIIDGDGRASGTETLTIQNIQFEGDGSKFCSGTDAFVIVPSTKDTGMPYTTGKYNYAHNITIKDCSFTSTNDDYSKVVGFKSTSGATCYNLVVSNVTGNNLHSLAQLTATEGATFEGCSATQTGSFIGINGGTSTTESPRAYTITGCTFESRPDKTDGYAIRQKSSSTIPLTLSDNNFKARDAIILGSNATITVESGTYDGTISQTNGTLTITGGTFSADPSDYVAEGYNCFGTADGKYIVKNATAVAQIGDVMYESLEVAFAAANDGETVKLLTDVDATSTMYSGDSRYNLWIKSGITLDGANHTVTVKGRGIGVQGKFDKIDVTFKDITVKNVGNVDGRCVDTRGSIASLTLNGVTLTTGESLYSGYLQPLTIGGSQSTATTVTITNSNIITVDNAKKGYAITTFNPVNLSIDDSTLKGWACLNLKGADNSAGSKNSIITITNSTLVSANGTPGSSNSYSLIKIEDDNINVDITGSTVNVNGEGNTQSIVSFQKLDQSSSNNCTVSMGDGNNVTLEGDYNYSSSEGETSKLVISGGTFNQPVPEQNCAEGMIPADLGDGKYSVKVGSYVAQIGTTKYETLEAALDAAVAADNNNIVVNLLNDAKLDVTAWSPNDYSIGSATTESITINGNGHTLDFVQHNSDWSNVSLVNDAGGAKLVLNDMNVTNSGYNNSAWNRHDINFNCAVELNNVTSDKAFAFKKDAKLRNVTINEDGTNSVDAGVSDVYAIWIQPHGQTIDIDGLIVNAVCEGSNTGRGIKIDDQYVSTPQTVSLSIANASFTTEAKSAILVKNAGQTTITVGENIDISGVAADKTNVVWVDENRATEYYKVTTTGATMVPEGGEATYTACLIRGEQIRGYYKSAIEPAITAAQAEDTVKILKAGSYTLPGLPANITIEGAVEGVVFNCVGAEGTSIASVPYGATFKNVTFNFGNVNYHGFQHAGIINMEGCTLNGKLFSYGDMNFTNCQFKKSESDYNMWCYSGNITYTNCTFERSQKGHLHLYNEDGTTRWTVTVNDCAFINDGAANKAAINVKATCGSKLLAYDVIINSCTTEGAFPEAVGDTYNSDNTYIISPLVQVDDRSIYPDNITVKLDDVLVYPVTYVAAIGTKKYQTLEAAFAAAADGATVTLLANASGNGIKVPEGKYTTGLTVDFGGFTYTVDGATVGSTGTETQAFQLLKDNIITFKNGKIYSEVAKMLVQNYSNLTLEGMTLTLNNSSYTSAYTLSNNNGTVVIDGSTINANPAGGFAFDVCRYASYPSVNVEVKGESVINGNIEISASGNDAKDGFSLTLTAGTFNGNIVLDASAEAVLNATPEKAVIKKNNSLTTVAAPQDYKWVDNSDGTSTLAPCVYVAQIGETKYESLTAAVNAATTGQTIELLADITTETGNKSLKEGVTLDGKGKTISGNIAIYISKNGGTVQNVNFKNIHNSSSRLSAIYATGEFGGTVTVTGCTFDNCDWDAIQITPVAGANVVITNNTFSNDTEDGIQQQRYIHVQSAQNVDFSATITGNVLNGKTAQDPLGVYYPTDKTKVDLKNNYIENVDDICILITDNNGYAGELVFPAYTTAAKEETYTPEAYIQNDQYSAKFYMTFAEAATAAGNDKVISLVTKPSTAYTMSEGQTLKVKKNGMTFSTPKGPDGFVVTSTTTDGVTTYTLAEAAVKYAATNGTESYLSVIPNTLEAGTYTLLKDLSQDNYVQMKLMGGTPVTIDLNGYNFTYTGYREGYHSAIFTSRSSKTLNIVNNGEGGGVISATNENIDQIISVQNSNNNVTIGAGVIVQGCVTMFGTGNNLTIEGTINGGNDFAVATNGSTTKNATITINDGAVLTSNVTAMYLPGTGTTTISGGTITGSNGVYVKSGELNITGGEITGNGETAEFVHNPNGTSIVGAALVVENCSYPGGAPTVNVTGGTFTSVNADAIASYSYGDGNEPISQFVHGGYFSTELDRAICEADKKTVPSTEKPGYYELGDIVYVAKIGETKYETLEEAWNAVNDGETITLLANCEGNGLIAPQGKFTNGLTVDFASFTYSVTGNLVGSTGTETQAFQLLKNNKITFKNGTITSEKALFLVQNYSNLTLQGMTLTLNNENHASAYTLSNNNGTVVIDGSTINANEAGGFAFDVCRYSSYPSVNVTVTGASVINGDIEISASASDAKDGFSLMLESGTFKGDIVLDPSAAAAMSATPDKASVTKNDDVDIDAPEDYMWVSNNDGTSSLGLISDQDIVLIDKEPYTFTKTTDVKSVTYKRTLSDKYTGYYISWYVPFDYTITAEDAESMTFYKIHMIANSNKPGEVEETDKIWVYLTKMGAGDKLYANRPYVFKAPNAGTTVTYSFTTNNTKLYAPTTGSRMNTSTSKFDYNFYGTYDSTPLEKNLLTYYTNSNGKVSATGNTSVTLTSYRWYIKATAKYGDGEGYAPVFVFTEDDDDATGISQRDNVVTEESYYNLNGMRINKPAKGTYIIKYSDGSVKKVAVK